MISKPNDGDNKASAPGEHAQESFADFARRELQLASSNCKQVISNLRNDDHKLLHGVEFAAVAAVAIATHHGVKAIGEEFLALKNLKIDSNALKTIDEKFAAEIIPFPKKVITLPEPHDFPREKFELPVVDTNSTEEMQRVRKLITSEKYTVLGKMKQGLNGAYLVRNNDGEHLIFKAVSRDDVTAQINISAKSAAAVDSIAGRTPRYEEVRFTPGQGSWYVQSMLEGKPAANPTDKLIGQMLNLNDRQAGKAITGSRDWNNTVYGALFEDRFGWQRDIAHSGEEGKDLVRRVKNLADDSRLFVPNAADIVHGDFQHYNALVSSTDRLTGYVDWEGAGLGDRSIDMTRLLFDSYVSEAEKGFRANPATLQMMRDRVKEVSGDQALKSGMSYWILQVNHYGTFCDKTKFRQFLSTGRRILDDLEGISAAKSSAA